MENKTEWQKKLEKIQTTLSSPNPEERKQILEAIREFFNSLPSTGKLVVGVVSLLLLASVLKIILSLIQLAITVVFLLLVGYLVYLWLERQANE